MPKIAAKRKSKKLVIVELPKTEAPTSADSVVAALASMQASPGWAIVVKILNDNIAYLERAILEKFDPVSKMELTDADVEILRTKRNLNIDLRDTPQNFSKIALDTGEVPEEYDPYYKENKDIVNDKRASRKD